MQPVGDYFSDTAYQAINQMEEVYEQIYNVEFEHKTKTDVKPIQTTIIS